MAWVDQLSAGDQEIVCRISTYFCEDISFVEKVKRARLIALMDQEYDPVVANSGELKALDILRVANFILTRVK